MSECIFFFFLVVILVSQIIILYREDVGSKHLEVELVGRDFIKL